MSPEIWGVVGVIGAAVVGGIFTLLASRQNTGGGKNLDGGAAAQLLSRLTRLQAEFAKSYDKLNDSNTRIYIGRDAAKLRGLLDSVSAVSPATATKLVAASDGVTPSDGKQGYEKLLSVVRDVRRDVEGSLKRARN